MRSAWAPGSAHSILFVTREEYLGWLAGERGAVAAYGPLTPTASPFLPLPSVLLTYSHCCRVPGLQR